jgi:hypothetical protein
MSAGVGHQPWVVILTDLKNMAVCQDKQFARIKCKGKQIHLKTELKLLNNLNLFCFINYIKTRTVLYRKKPRGPTRLKSRTLDWEINRNQTRNQEITREISEFWNQKSLKTSLLLSPQSIWQRSPTEIRNRVRNQEIAL